MKKQVGVLFLIMAMFLTSLPMHVFAEEAGKLMYRLADYDETNEEYVENTENLLQTSYETVINGEDCLFFYYVENGEETPVSASELTVSDEEMIMLMEREENPYMSYIGAVGVGSTEISYENNGTVYSVNVVVGLPEMEVYSDKIASADTLLTDGFTLTDTEKTFYVVTTGDWKLTEVVLEEELQQFAEVAVSEDKTYAMITIIGSLSEESWGYTIECSAKNSSNHTIERELSVWIESEVPIVEAGLNYRFAILEGDTPVEDTDELLYSFYEAEPGDKVYVWFYYVENEEETMLSLSDLTSSDEEVVKLSEDASGAILMEILKEGSATIDYVKDDATYSVNVEADVFVEDIAFYLDNTSDSKEYIDEFTVTDKKNSFYLVANNGWSIADVILEEDFAKIAEVSVGEDGAYALIIVTGTPKDGVTYMLDYVLDDSNDGTLESSLDITLYNQKSEGVPPTGENPEDGTEDEGVPPTEENPEDDTENNNSTEDKEENTKPSQEPDKDSPETNDNSSIGLWMSVFVAGFGLTIMIVFGLRKKM